MRRHPFPVQGIEDFEVVGAAAHDPRVSADTGEIERHACGKAFCVAAPELIFYHHILAGLRIQTFHHVEHFRLKLHSVNIVRPVGTGVGCQDLRPALLNDGGRNFIPDDLRR